MHSPTTLKLDPITMDYIKQAIGIYILEIFQYFYRHRTPGAKPFKIFQYSKHGICQLAKTGENVYVSKGSIKNRRK